MAIPGRKDARDALIFSAPFLVVYGLFLVFPLCFGLFISFFDWDILSTRHFVGFGNYLKLFSDAMFYRSLWHTVQFVLLSTPPLLVVGFAMALTVTSSSVLKNVAENVYFLPYILSMTVVGTLWAWLMQKDYGFLNLFLRSFGLSGAGWLVDPSLAMWSVVLATLWWTAGFNMVLFSAGMKQIPQEIYESADMDGASYAQKLFGITIPLLSPTTTLCLILQIIASFNVFGQVFVMTGGGPYGTTRVLTQYIYEAGFKYFKMGYSAAMSYILFLIVLGVSAVQYAALRKNEA